MSAAAGGSTAHSCSRNPSTGANDEAVQADAGENLLAKPERNAAAVQEVVKDASQARRKNRYGPDVSPRRSRTYRKRRRREQFDGRMGGRVIYCRFWQVVPMDAGLKETTVTKSNATTT